MVNLLLDTSQQNLCSRCGLGVGNRAIRSAIRCKVCNRLFHQKCYLAETGLKKEETSSCVCCLCGILQVPKCLSVQEYPIAAKFLRDGYCVISLAKGLKEQRVLLEKLEKYRINAEIYFTSFMRSYEAKVEFSATTPTLETGFSNFRKRGNGRFELISTEIKEEVLSIVENCDYLMSNLDILLSSKSRGNRVSKRVMATGCFYSLPGSSKQDVHTDGPSLSSVVDLYPYAVNIFIPLVSVDKSNGTEVFPGSHRMGWRSKPAEKQKSLIPSVPLGKALLFDYRLLHRGLANQRGSPRPCYYLTFARSWYEDKFNFSSSRYRTALQVPSYLLERRGDESVHKRKRTE